MLFARSTKELDPVMAFVVEHRLIGIGVVVAGMLLQWLTWRIDKSDYGFNMMSPKTASFISAALLLMLLWLLDTYRFY